MSKAIEAKFECKACGSTVNKRTTINTTQKKNKYSFDAPDKCACGAKCDSFELLNFKEMESIIVSLEDKKKIVSAIGMKEEKPALIKKPAEEEKKE